MTQPITKLLTFGASYGDFSKTLALTKIVTQKVAARYTLQTQQYSMTDLGKNLGLARSIEELEDSAKQVVQAMEEADALIIATPVFKGSYPGLFKHFIDLLAPEIFYGKPILIAATGGGDRHALMVEHQLRPLFGFFMAHSLPTAIYASVQDYGDDNTIINQALLQRIDQAITEFGPFISASPQKNHEELPFLYEQTPPHFDKQSLKLIGGM